MSTTNGRLWECHQLHRAPALPRMCMRIPFSPREKGAISSGDHPQRGLFPWKHTPRRDEMMMLETTRRMDNVPYAPPGLRNLPCSASQASKVVSVMRGLRPMWTTGRRPEHRSLAKTSGLTPNHRCASSRGISCGDAGISRGKTCCRADGRVLGRMRLGGIAIAGVVPFKSQVFDAGGGNAPQTHRGWPEPVERMPQGMLILLS